MDDPQTTVLRRRIIRSNPFLRRIYLEWYAMLLSALPPGGGSVVEIGSGAGFLKDIFPDIICSEMFPCADIHLAADARLLPFAGQSLRAIFLTNVLHHISQPRRFFAEAACCVRPGGVIAMVEPWVNRWAAFIYTHLHHEPFLPDAREWEFPEGGVLSAANGAMPWIILKRDRAQFEEEFPEWEITGIEPFMPLRYLLSGGVSMRGLMPGWSLPFWRMLEWPFRRNAGMFASIVLTRRRSIADNKNLSEIPSPSGRGLG